MASKFEVGDRALIVGNTIGKVNHFFMLDDEVEILTPEDEDGDYDTRRLSDGMSQYVNRKDLEPLRRHVELEDLSQ